MMILCAVSGRVTGLNLYLAQPYIPVHRPVPQKAVQRAFEAGGPVFLKTKVAYPGKTIAAEQAVQQILQLASCYQHHQKNQAHAGADKVQATASFVAVLGQVKRVKLAEGLKHFWVLHVCHQVIRLLQ